MKTTRGFTLIEAMVLVAMLGIGAVSIANSVGGYTQAGVRARSLEAVAAILDQEMENLRACSALHCLRRRSFQSEQWPFPQIDTRVSPGPGGTQEVHLTARLPSIQRPMEVAALLRVGP